MELIIILTSAQIAAVTVNCVWVAHNVCNAMKLMFFTTIAVKIVVQTIISKTKIKINVLNAMIHVSNVKEASMINAVHA